MTIESVPRATIAKYKVSKVSVSLAQQHLKETTFETIESVSRAAIANSKVSKVSVSLA